MELYPLKFRPIFKERIWGGNKLAEMYGKQLPEGVKIGESWEIADLPGDKSQVINGVFAGSTIDRILRQYPDEITGHSEYKPFPLLIKILDAQEDLSLQVHPDKDACMRMGQGDPKTECWYIIDARPGACIYKGLKEGVTRDQFESAVKDGTTAGLLNKIEVEVGQCHLLPSGTVHAVGKGLIIAEIQQPSDTTYRVFDWNRVDKDGKSRQLHIAQALECIHFDPSGDDLSVKTSGRLVDSQEFKVDKVTRKIGDESIIKAGDMKVMIFISGSGIFSGKDHPVHFSKGRTILVPADYSGVMTFEQDTLYLVARPG